MHPGTIWSNRLKAVAFAFGLVLSLFSALNWWSIYDRHAPPCSPECAADFVTFYTAAKLLVDHPAALYDLDHQFADQKRIAPSQEVLPFVYPPITAMLMAPLAWLPFSNAFLAMTLLNGTLLWLSLRNLIHQLSLSQDQSHWLILFTLCNYGVHQVFYQAQVSVIILFFLTQYILSQKQGNDGRTGAWAGLLCVKPQFFPMPCFYLFLQGRWRGLMVGIFVSTALTIGAFFLVGAEATQHFFLLLQRMMTNDHDWWNQARSMHNLRALAVYWLPPEAQAYFWWSSCGLVISLVVWINLRARQRPDTFAACWITNMIGLLLVSPHLFAHDLTILILPCALFLVRFKKSVPAPVGMSLTCVAALPILNQSLPTITATALLSLFLLHFRSTAATLTR